MDGLTAARFFDRPGPRRRGLWPSISAWSSGPRNTVSIVQRGAPVTPGEETKPAALSIRVVDSQPSCLPTY
jgi:hypothetical protein